MREREREREREKERGRERERERKRERERMIREDTIDTSSMKVTHHNMFVMLESTILPLLREKHNFSPAVRVSSHTHELGRIQRQWSHFRNMY